MLLSKGKSGKWNLSFIRIMTDYEYIMKRTGMANQIERTYREQLAL